MFDILSSLLKIFILFPLLSLLMTLLLISLREAAEENFHMLPLPCLESSFICAHIVCIYILHFLFLPCAVSWDSTWAGSEANIPPVQVDLMSSHLRRIFAHDHCPPFLHQFFFFYWVILTSTQACSNSVYLKKKETNPLCIGFSSSDCPISWIFLVGKFLNVIFIHADSVFFFFFN